MALKTAEQYIESLGRLKPAVYVLGERVENFVEHPLLRPQINAVAATYEFAQDKEYGELATTVSPFTGDRINRFLHMVTSTEDLVKKVKINRLLGRKVGTCFSRCTGLDMLNALFIITYEVDQKYGTEYHQRLKAYIKYLQQNDFACHCGNTHVKGDRSLRPSEQPNPDAYIHVVEKKSDGIVVRGAKIFQTGSLCSHESVVAPSREMREADRDYAVAFAVPIDAPGVIHIYQRGTLDSRYIEGVDIGNIKFGKFTTLIIFDNVFVPWERVFMCGEYEFAGPLVRTFATYHRVSHGGCKSGWADVAIGAASTIAEYNGISRASHINEKLTDMIYMTETMYSCSLASAAEGQATPSGVYTVNSVMANTSKLHEVKFCYEICRLLLDIAGGLGSNMPSEKDLRNPQIGSYLEKYLKGVNEVPTEHRMRMFRLIEKLAFESNDLGSHIHGAGSAQANRITLLRETDLAERRKLAKVLAGIDGEAK